MDTPYITVPICSGLGNQLFMMAAAFGFQQLCPGVKLVFCDKEQKGDRPRGWAGFFADCPRIEETRVRDLPPVKWDNVGNFNTCFVFHNYLGIIRRNARNGISTSITGCFQNIRYMPERSLLLDVFNIAAKQENLRNKLPLTDYDNICSMHFRLGDYKNHPHKYPLNSDEYYRLALDKVKENKPNINKILVVNERKEQRDIEQRMANIAGQEYQLIYVTSLQLQDWEELVLMSMCRANIIANSTFSWWAAFFNCYPDATVIYPRDWVHIDDVVHWNLSQPGWICL